MLSKNNYPTITILSGPPGSGKSTWAVKELKKNLETCVVLSRDALRNSLFGNNDASIEAYYNHSSAEERVQIERVVTREYKSLLMRAITSDKDVIADNTHLETQWFTSYNKFPAYLKYESFTGLPYEMLVLNNKKRVRQLPENKLYDLYQKANSFKSKESEIISFINEHNKYVDMHITNNSTNPPCYVFDIDGTLAHADNRDPHDYSRVITDSVDPNIMSIFNTFNYNSPVKCFVVSGRTELCRRQTEDWFSLQGMYNIDIHMRKQDDSRPDWIIKQEIWADICKTYYIGCMFDDRDQVVTRARQLGFKVAQVAHGDF